MLFQLLIVFLVIIVRKYRELISSIVCDGSVKLLLFFECVEVLLRWCLI